MKLVLIHGSGGMKESWFYQTRHFPDAEAIDLPGHPQGRPCSSVDAYTEWVRGFLAGRGYRDVVLAGWSLGGAITLNYALKHPADLKGIILTGTGARLRVLPATLQGLKAAVQDPSLWQPPGTVDYPELTEAEREALRAKQRAIGPAVHLNDLTCCDMFDLMDQVQEIRLPALVMCGTEDALTPPKYSLYLAAKLPNASPTLIVEGATHGLPRERPDLVNAAIEEFLRRLR